MILIEDILIIARTVYGEARGEDMEGKLAVAQVIQNRYRAQHRKETTYIGVCTEPKQFSCWNPDDSNRAKLEAATPDDQIFRDCLIAALESFDTEIEDLTNGALHYHAKSIEAYWAQGKIPCADIGKHYFYNNVA